jgi:hypothetical protein
VAVDGRPFRFLLPHLRRLWARNDLLDRIQHGFAAAADTPEWRDALAAFDRRRRGLGIYPD